MQRVNRIRVSFVLALVVATAAAGARAQAPLSADEMQLVEIVAANNDDALALLEQVVDINSGTMNFEGVRAVADIFAAELDALGFKTEWIDGSGFERSGHLLGERPGDGPHIILIGHLDTVFEKDSPFQRFEPRPDGTAGGPGVVDMKGGDVIALFALKALLAVGALDRMHITIVLSGDEERPGDPIDAAREALVDAAQTADYVLAFENGDNNPTTAVVARRGNSRWRLTVEAKPAHSSLIFRDDIGAGAIYEVSRILNEFYESMAGEEYLTFNPGLILGGTDVDYDSTLARGNAFGKSNVIAEHAIVTGDLRTISPDQLARAKTTMRAIVADNRPHATATLVFEDRYPPMAPSDGNLQLLELYNRVSEDLGLGPVTPVNPMQAGAADVAFTAELVGTAIDGIGLMGGNDHTEAEFANLATLPTQTQRAAVFLYRLSNR